MIAIEGFWYECYFISCQKIILFFDYINGDAIIAKKRCEFFPKRGYFSVVGAYGKVECGLLDRWKLREEAMCVEEYIYSM